MDEQTNHSGSRRRNRLQVNGVDPRAVRARCKDRANRSGAIAVRVCRADLSDAAFRRRRILCCGCHIKLSPAQEKVMIREV